MITFKWKSIGTTARKVARNLRGNHGSPNTGVIAANSISSTSANTRLKSRWNTHTAPPIPALNRDSTSQPQGERRGQSPGVGCRQPHDEVSAPLNGSALVDKPAGILAYKEQREQRPTSEICK